MNVVRFNFSPGWVLVIRALQDDGIVRKVTARRGSFVKEFNGPTGTLTDLRGVFLEDIESFKGCVRLAC